jgi:hypothetical protein
VSSAGADAVEFAASCGLFLDDWQVWCLDQMLAEDRDGRWCASQIALILPRQNGKNAVLEALELYALFVLDETRIIHTAHLAKTAADHMRRMVQLIHANDELDAITHIYWSNGKEALERTDNGAFSDRVRRGVVPDGRAAAVDRAGVVGAVDERRGSAAVHLHVVGAAAGVDGVASCP